MPEPTRGSAISTEVEPAGAGGQALVQTEEILVEETPVETPVLTPEKQALLAKWQKQALEGRITAENLRLAEASLYHPISGKEGKKETLAEAPPLSEVSTKVIEAITPVPTLPTKEHYAGVHAEEYQAFQDLVVSGASVAEQVAYLEAHPFVARSRSVQGLIEPIRSQLGELGELQGEDAFNRQVELGFIPAGSEYVPPPEGSTQWGYYNPQQVRQMAQQEHREERFTERNTQLPDGQYIDTEELRELATTSPDVYHALITGGFGAADKIIATQQTAVDKQAQATTVLHSYGFVEGELSSENISSSNAPPLKEFTIQNMAEFVRSNPDGTQILANYGFSEDVLNSVSEYNSRTTDLVAYIDAGVMPQGAGLSQGLGLSGSEISALGRALQQVGVKPVSGSYVEAWRELDDTTKRTISEIIDKDWTKGSMMASLAADIESISATGLPAAMLTAPIQPITTVLGKAATLDEAKSQLGTDYEPELSQFRDYIKPDGTFDIEKIDKALVSNPELLKQSRYDNAETLKSSLEYYNYSTQITPQEWGTAGVVAVLDVLAVGGSSALLSMGTTGRRVLGLIQIGTGAFFIPRAVETISDPNASIVEKAISGAVPVILIAGGAFTLKPEIVAASRAIGNGARIAYVNIRDLISEISTNEAGYFALNETVLEKSIRLGLSIDEKSALINLISKRLSGTELVDTELSQLDNLLEKGVGQYSDSLTSGELEAIRSMARGYAPEISGLTTIIQKMEATGITSPAQKILQELPAEAQKLNYIPANELKQLYLKYELTTGGFDDNAFLIEAAGIEAQRATLWATVANAVETTAPVTTTTPIILEAITQATIQSGIRMPAKVDIAKFQQAIQVLRPDRTKAEVEQAREEAELRAFIREFAMKQYEGATPESAENIGDTNWALRNVNVSASEIAEDLKTMSDSRVNERLKLIDENKANAVREILGIKPELKSTSYIAINSLTNEEILALFSQLERSEVEKYIKYLHEDRIKQLAELAIDTSTQTATLVEVRNAIKAITAIEVAAETAAKTETETKTETELATILLNLTETKTELQNKLAEEAETQALTSTEVMPIAEVVPITEVTPITTETPTPTPVPTTVTGITPSEPVEPIEPIEPVEPTPTPTEPKEPTEPIKPLILPTRGGNIVERQRRQVALPSGSVAFKMGFLWKYLPPPWNQRRFITLPRDVIPMGAINTDLITPQETIQMIGETEAKVPETISADMGVVDAEVYNFARAIRFAGKGTLTNVGTRIDSRTRGIAIPSEYEELSQYSLSPLDREKAKGSFRRPVARKLGRSRKSRNWLDDVTGLQGIRY